MIKRVILLCMVFSYAVFAGGFYLDKHTVEINANFGGDTINLYGIHGGIGKIVIVLKGERETYYIQKKEKRFGIWTKGERREFKNVYRYYNIASETSLDKLRIGNLLKRFEIGIENISTDFASLEDAIEAFEYQNALLHRKMEGNLFVEDYGKTLINTENLVYMTYKLPKNIPAGNYVVSVYNIDNGKVISVQNIPLYIRQMGLLKFMKDVSSNKKALYFSMSIISSIGFSAVGYLILNGGFFRGWLFLVDKLKRAINRIKPNLIKTKRRRGRPRKKKA